MRPSVSFGREDFRQSDMPGWLRYEWRQKFLAEAAEEGRTMTREEADYMIDKAIAYASAIRAQKRRRIWLWGWVAWAAAFAIFALIVAAKADERLHDGAACFNDYGEPGHWYGQHCYIDSDD